MLQTRHRLVDPARLPEDMAEKKMRGAARRIERDGMPQARLGLRRFAFLVKNFCPAQPARCSIGRSRGRAAEAVDRLGAAAVDEEQIAQPVVRIGKLWGERDGTPEGGDRCALTTL